MWQLISKLCLFVLILVLTEVWSSVYTGCRVTIKESRGVITTPNFPNPYPVPISCQWVIEAPADKVIAVYFTQFYMREGLRATEYAYYSYNVKMGKTEFGTISSEREPTYLVSNKPVLVLDFAVREVANIHMRVREFLLDVFGFNITYEMIARNESVRKDACLYHHCSFTGNCFATPQYDRYYCQCFAKYFGDECQYDLECGPTAVRNMCQNGGTCRYYIGSTVRTCECPPGFDGARCETQVAQPLLIECPANGCNSSCRNLSSGVSALEALEKCSHEPHEEDKMRYVIILKLTHPKVDNILPERKKYENFKKEMEKALQLLLKPRLEMATNITVLELRVNSEMKFHLFAKKSDHEELKATIEEMLKVGKLGSFDFDPKHYETQMESALKIIGIEASEKMPLVEGSELTLACIIKGTSALQVEWFKDDIHINVHSTERGMWNTIVPKNSQEQYTALLGFDRTTNLDSGHFICKASDWGFQQNKTIQVSILSAPQPLLTPMTSTIFQGDQIVITCLSQEDIYGTFGYTWLKNGQILNPSMGPEKVEDLFPAGSRILLDSAKSSAVYTCIITSSAGSARKDSIITVLDKGRKAYFLVLAFEEAVPLCLPEEKQRVRWSLAASNTEDVQLCPIGYTGDVRRHCCLTNGHGAQWKEPDFSGCFSSSFLSLKRKVDSLQMGYLLSDVNSLLNELKFYLHTNEQDLQISEGEPIVDLLQKICGIAHGNQNSTEGWKVFLDIASTLLGSGSLIKKHSKIIQLHEQIFHYGFHYNSLRNNLNFEIFKRKDLAVELGQIHKRQKLPLIFPSKEFSAKSSKEFQWISDSIELNLTRINAGNFSGEVVVVFYRNLSSYLPERFVTRKGVVDVEYQLMSSLVAVRVNDYNLPSQQFAHIKIKLANFNHTAEKHIRWNISCAMVDFSQGNVQFTTSGCHKLWTIKNITLCDCQQLGIYGLLLTHYTIFEDVHGQTGFDTIAGVGCSICAFFLLITFFLLLSFWGKIKGVITALKLQVCIALLGAYGTIFCGLDNSLSEHFYPYIVTLIQFFLLASFSLQLCIGLAVYNECIDFKDLHYSSIKITAIGWAIPVIVLGATLSAQSLYGFSLDSWWLTLGSNFFYAYTSSILILTMFQVLLFITVKTEIRNHRKVTDFLHKKKSRVHVYRAKLLHRSLLLTTTLLLVSAASILYVNFNQFMFAYFFAASSTILGLVVFLCYTICSERQFSFCCIQVTEEDCCEPQGTLSRSRSNSFKSFLKPEIIDDNYTNKFQIDIEKRTDRIKRMYSQIEKASLASDLQKGVTERLVQKDALNCKLCSSSHSTMEQHMHSDRSHSLRQDPIYCANSKNDSYSSMNWKGGNHPHLLYAASVSGCDSCTNNEKEDQSIMQKSLLQCETEHCLKHLHSESYDKNRFKMDRNRVYVNGGDIDPTSEQENSFISSITTFEGPVKVDVMNAQHSQYSISSVTKEEYGELSDVQENVDDADDKCSLKSSCFLHLTDSLETVVYRDQTVGATCHSPLSPTVLDTISSCSNMCPKNGLENSHPEGPPSWNMTSV